MSNEKASGDLRIIQLLQLDLLSEIDRICRENNLKYYIIAGTLLGAVRHGGFIPWDSDIDIAMFRKDYDKLMEIGNSKIDEKYFIQSDKSDPNTRSSFAKVRINDTKFIEKGNKIKDSHYGFYVDIFPLDDIKGEPSKTDFLFGKFLKLLQRIKAFRNGKVFSTKFSRTLIALISSAVTIFIPKRVIDSIIYKAMTKDNNKGYNYVTNYCSRYGIKKQFMSYEIYGEPVEIEFEGRKFWAPNQYLYWLDRIYGNYMELPPEKERITTIYSKYDYDLGPFKNMKV